MDPRWFSLPTMFKLARIWTSAAVVSFSAVMLIYSRFFGRFRVVPNAAIYRGHYKVGQAGTTELFTREGHGRTSYGENGLVVDKALDPKVFRVLILGDSFVQARGVSDHEKFTEIIEREWNASHPEKPIQTLNMGLGGLDMPDYLFFGDNINTHFHPDLVLLFVHEGDFVSSSELERASRLFTRPAAKPPGSAVLDAINWMGCYGFYRQLRLQTRALLGKSDLGGELQGNQERLARVDREAVATQVAGAKSIWGRRLVIVYYKRISGLGRDAPGAYDDPILREIEEQDIPVINLYRPFLGALQAQKPPVGFNNSMLGQGHLNRYGHQLVACQMLAFLEARDGFR